METGDNAGQRAGLSSAFSENVGPYTFALAYRDVDVDQGLTLHEFGPVHGKREEILRFDCFEQTPHYHLGWSYRDEPFIKISDPDPLTWALDSLRDSFEGFVSRAGADLQVTSEFRAEIEAVLERIRAEARG